MELKAELLDELLKGIKTEKDLAGRKTGSA